ncbi:MAG: hypothetical protein KAS16_03165 [Thermoplasmata archaeon]|nr:hypothetical protein [Thermoplasmata archaeon]
MPSSYLKAMQLTKQLEEKAKEASKNRIFAEEELLSSEKALEKAKSIDIKLDDAVELYQQAVAAFDDKEYKNALSLATRSNELTNERYTEHAMEIISSTDTLLNMVKGIGKSKPVSEALLEEAHEVLKDHDYDKAISLSKQCWEGLEKVVLEHLSDEFSSAQSMIVLARNSGEDISSSESLLENAREYMGSQDYAGAMDNIKQCISGLNTGIQAQIDELSDEARGFLISAKELEADVSKVEELLAKIETEQGENELEKALSTSRLCKSEAEKTLSISISSNIEEHMADIEKAETIKANTEKSNEILNRARNALKNSNYGEALNALKDSGEEIQNCQFQKVLKTMSQSRSKFMKAKKYGADLDEAMDFMNKARDALKEEDFLESLQMANQGDKVVEEIIALFDQAGDKFEEYEKGLEEAKEIGVDITEAESMFSKAKTAFENNNLADAKKYQDGSAKILDSTLYSFITDMIETAELVISAGDSLGAILDEPNDFMHNAIKAVKEGEYKIALKDAERAVSRAEDIIKIHVSNTIASADLALMEVEDVDEDAIEKLIQGAKTDFEKNTFDEAFRQADKALSMMETAQSAKSRESITKMEHALRIAKDMECDLTSIDKDIKMAHDGMTNRDFQTALEIADGVYKNTINIQKATAEREFGNAKIEVIEAKKLGIDIGEMRDALKRAKSGFEKGDFKTTFQESKKTLLNAHNIIEKHQAAYESMTQAAAMVAEAKKNDADVTSVMENLLKARSSFEKTDYDKVIELSDMVKAEADMIVSLYTSANNLANANGYLEHLKTLEVDVEDLSKLIEEAKTALKSKDVKASVELSDKADNNALDLLNNTITNLISEAESSIIDAKEIGIDVTEPKSKLDMAKTQLTESEFKASIDLAQKAKEDVIKLKDLSQNAALRLKELQDKVSEAENIYANIDGIKAILNKAMKELGNHNYEDVINLSEEGIKETKTTIEEYVSETISNFRGAAEKAKADGVSVVAAEKLLDQAKTAFENKEYKAALELAMRSEGELEKVGLQQDMAAKAIGTAETKLEEANKQGIFSRQAKNLLESAQKDIKNGDYVKALEQAIQSGDELYKVREEFTLADEQMDNLNTQIKVAVEIGVEISLAKKLQADAQEAMTGHDYKTASEIVKEGLVEARRLTYSKLTNKINDTYKLIDTGTGFGLDMGGLGSVISEAKTFMETGKFNISNEKITLVSSDAKNRLNKHVMNFIDNSETSAKHARDIGVDITETLKLLEESKASLSIGKHKKAMEQAKESVSKISDLQKGVEKEFIELTYKANSLISMVKKFGINVKEAEELFKQARDIKADDHKQAVKLVNDSIIIAQKTIDEFRPKLIAKIVDDRVTKGHWVDTELTITNTGKTLGTDISIKMLGDIEVYGEMKIDKLMGGGNQISIPIKIRFSETVGSQPVILELSSHRLLDNKKFVDKMTTSIVVVEEIQVEVKEKEKIGPSFERLKAPDDLKCNICMGTVKKGLEIIKCSCGKEYHGMCATRFGKCANCGNSFAEKLEEDAEKDILDDLGDTKPAASIPTTAPTVEKAEPTPEKPEEKAPEPKPEPTPPAAAPATPPAKPEEKPEEKKAEPKKRMKLRI